MAVKPILFNTEMVRAILDGRKTMTRRAIKPKYREDEHEFCVCTNKATGEVTVEKMDEDGGTMFHDGNTRYVNPPYQPDDVLYVRETWAKTEQFGLCDGYIYKADQKEDYEEIISMTKWHPSIHMPKEAARIWLKVTDVRAERLHDITNAEARKEGAETEGYLEMQEQASVCGLCSESLRDYFGTAIWDSTIKKKDLPLYGWDANPYVWVVEFERIEKPEDIK